MRFSTVAERVAAGAAWLDEQAPGWVDRINLDELAMANCKQCVLGQTFGDYWNAPLPRRRPLRDGEFRTYQSLAVAYGFQSALVDDGSADDPSAEYYALSVAWWDLIEARRGVSR